MPEHTKATLAEITDVDFDLTLQNAQENSDPHLYASIIKVFRSNPRFVFRLLAAANERANALTTNEAERQLIEDAMLEGAALVIAVQLQHATSSVPPIDAIEAMRPQAVDAGINTAA